MVQISTPLGWPLTGEWAPREALFVKLLWPLVFCCGAMICTRHSCSQARSQGREGGAGGTAPSLNYCAPRSLLPSSCQCWYSTLICELFCVFHQVSCKWYSCLAKFWHLYMRTAAERDRKLPIICSLYCLKKILVKLIKICKFLSDS